MVRHLSIAVTVVIPTGSFMMGSPASEPERRENEPQHKVTIRRTYAIGKDRGDVAADVDRERRPAVANSRRPRRRGAIG